MNAVDLAIASAVLALAAVEGAFENVGPLLLSHEKSWASFDRDKATTVVEKLICSDPTLSEWDGLQGFMYRQLVLHAPTAERSGIRARQRTWLRQRDACSDKECLQDLYYAREDSLREELDHWDRVLRRPLSRVGRCQVTSIEYIGPRLGMVPTSHDRPSKDGTTVTFANGVRLVSYDYQRPVAQSRLGDPTRVCLVSIPQNCPRGDDRGREYSVTNLRTSGTWRMPDSQHQCGGA